MIGPAIARQIRDIGTRIPELSEQFDDALDRWSDAPGLQYGTGSPGMVGDVVSG